MKNILVVTLIVFSSISDAQIITTIAGNGTSGDTGDGGAATAAEVSQPYECAFDSHDNFYFTEVEGDRVRMVNTSDIIITFAGGGSSLGDGGAPTDAQFNDPTGIAIDDSDNVYISDALDYRIRKISAITGIITSIAGNGIPGYGGDNGPATAAMINGNNVCVDHIGNIFICDVGNNRIRKINASGIISTYAGNGINGYTGDGGVATAAEISPVIGICTDASNNVYFVDGNNIRKISTAGIITTIAGNGLSSLSGDGGPATAAGIAPWEIIFDKFENLYISGQGSNLIRKIDNAGIIYTVAGNGIAGNIGDGGPATASELNVPIGVATDTCGNLFIADKNNELIRKITYPMCDYLSASNVNEEKLLKIYPNPVYDVLKIDNVKPQAIYRLLNIVGTAVQQGVLNEGNNSISVQAIPNGMYMLEMVDEEGGKMVKKFVKE